MELLAPAGNFAAARSAVHNGADAIYVGGRLFSARRTAENFDASQLKELVTYCHLRKVKVYVALNTLVREEELWALASMAEEIAASGADAAIVTDWGAVRLLRACCPTLPLHASTQMNIHSVAGVKRLERAGFSRVVLARELSAAEIAAICHATTLEVEVFAHGALCMSYSGNCYLSSVIGQKSGNRGLCAQPCRLPYEGDRYPLSLKDLCLLEHLDTLQQAGVTSLKIEGRLKSPEYVGSVTAAYRKALDGTPPTRETLRNLAHIFSRSGFTAGYWEERTGASMFGVKTKTAYGDYKAAVAAVSKTLEEAFEPKKRALSFQLVLGVRTSRLTVTCEDFSAQIEGQRPEPAFKKAVTAEDAVRSLSKLGGTPFALGECTARVAQDLFFPAAAFNALRREALKAVEAHFLPRPHPFRSAVPALPPAAAPAPLTLEPWFWFPEKARCALPPAVLRYWVNGQDPAACAPFAADPKAGVFLPPVLNDRALEALAGQLYARGFRHALCRHPGQIAPLRAAGFTVHGDFSFNLTNSQALAAYTGQLADVALSFELTLQEIKALHKPLPVGLIVYGRLPLMQTKNCLITNVFPCKKGQGAFLTDRTNRAFFVGCGAQCQNTLFNSQPLYLADRAREWRETGVSFGRLLFTDETPEQIAQILKAYEHGSRETPPAYTRGLYYRGVL